MLGSGKDLTKSPQRKRDWKRKTKADRLVLKETEVRSYVPIVATYLTCCALRIS